MELSTPTPQQEYPPENEAFSRLTLEAEVLQEVIVFAKGRFTEHAIPEARQSEFLDTYWTRLQQLTRQLSHNPELLRLHDLEATRKALIHDYTTQFNALQSDIATLKTELNMEPEMVTQAASPQSDSSRHPRRSIWGLFK